MFLSPDIAHAAGAFRASPAQNDPLKLLSTREFEIFRQLVSGRAPADIARALEPQRQDGRELPHADQAEARRCQRHRTDAHGAAPGPARTVIRAAASATPMNMSRYIVRRIVAISIADPVRRPWACAVARAIRRQARGARRRRRSAPVREPVCARERPGRRNRREPRSAARDQFVEEPAPRALHAQRWRWPRAGCAERGRTADAAAARICGNYAGHAVAGARSFRRRGCCSATTAAGFSRRCR